MNCLFIWLITHFVICLTRSSTFRYPAYSCRAINVMRNCTCFFYFSCIYGKRFTHLCQYWVFCIPCNTNRVLVPVILKHFFSLSMWIITAQLRDLYINTIMSLEIGHISTYLLKACDTHFSSHLPEVPIWRTISPTNIMKTMCRNFRIPCYVSLRSLQSVPKLLFRGFHACCFFLEHMFKNNRWHFVSEKNKSQKPCFLQSRDVFG